jgi:hypothetical protein
VALRAQPLTHLEALEADRRARQTQRWPIPHRPTGRATPCKEVAALPIVELRRLSENIPIYPEQLATALAPTRLRCVAPTTVDSCRHKSSRSKPGEYPGSNMVRDPDARLPKVVVLTFFPGASWRSSEDLPDEAVDLHRVGLG